MRNEILIACDYKESLWDKVWYFFQPWHVSQWILRTKQVSLLASFCTPSLEKTKFCCLLFLFLNYFPNFDKSPSILRASPGYYLRKTYHSCRCFWDFTKAWICINVQILLWKRVLILYFVKVSNTSNARSQDLQQRNTLRQGPSAGLEN